MIPDTAMTDSWRLVAIWGFAGCSLLLAPALASSLHHSIVEFEFEHGRNQGCDECERPVLPPAVRAHRRSAIRAQWADVRGILGATTGRCIRGARTPVTKRLLDLPCFTAGCALGASKASGMPPICLGTYSRLNCCCLFKSVHCFI